jgi:hypothetical protein
MATFEIIFYALHQSVEVIQIGLADIGGSYVIHMFGAYFGLTVSRVLSSQVRVVGHITVAHLSRAHASV